jgi:photosystem II stability/assembly factor-like uncharacterized protein
MVDVDVAAAAVVAPNDATAGSFQILSLDPGATVMSTFTFAGVQTDGAINATVDTLYQSTMGGGMWTDITARLPVADFAGGLDYVAIAPDDPNTVVVATANPAAGLGSAITINGGASWSSMGVIQDGAGANACNNVNDLDISRLVTGNFRYIALSGSDAAGPGLYYYNYGSGVGAWRNACVAALATDFIAGPIAGAGVAGAYGFVNAFEFSNNFPSDFMGVAVLEENTGAAADEVDLHILSFNARSWDTTIQTNYPVNLHIGAAGAMVVTKADISLLPDYDGQDETLRIAFVGANIADPAGTEAGGVWRCYDNANAVKIWGAATPMGISSVAFDGTNLAAGESATNVVWRSADPLITAPTFLPSRSMKRIGIDDVGGVGLADMVNIKFVDETLYGAKLGDASCISKSTDYGNTWNDFTLLDNAMTVIDDIYMVSDMEWYVSAHDGITSAVYRVSFFSVTRVLCVPVLVAGVAPAAANPDFMLRGIPSSPKVVYAADEGGGVIYYSADGGLERWYRRGNVPIAAMADLTVESAQVIYIADAASVNVYKSINAGFVWSLPMNSKLAGFNGVINMIVSVSENNVVVGGNAGGVAYTTDGGTNWAACGGGVMNTFTPVQVAASGLGAGDYIFAAEEGGNQIWRFEMGPGNPMMEWASMNFRTTADAAGAVVSLEVNTGLVYKDGILFVLQTDVAGTPAAVPAIVAGTSYITRSAAATIPGLGSHIGLFWGTSYAETNTPFLGFARTMTYNNSPTALKVCDGAPGSIMLYAIDTATVLFGAPSPGVFYFDDAIILGGPTLIGPADGARIDIVAPLTGAVSNVNFTWSRMSKATGYFLFIALDSGFTQLIGAPIPVPSTLDPVSSIQLGAIFLPGTSYYWRVSASTPISSGFSETRHFVVQPTAASVPSVSSPENGGSIDTTSPAFSWTPAAGATMYRFQLSVDPAFTTTLADTELATTGIAPAVTLERGKAYFWRVKAISPVEGDWSAVANFMVAQLPAPAGPPVVVETTPAPQINIPAPEAVPDIVLQPPAEETIAPAYIWAIIIIGAVLVIAVIVLIVRTRRSV